MVEDSREEVRAPETAVGDRLGVVREITETRAQNNFGNILPLVVLMMVISRNNFWQNGCGGNNLNNFF